MTFMGMPGAVGAVGASPKKTMVESCNMSSTKMPMEAVSPLWAPAGL